MSGGGLQSLRPVERVVIRLMEDGHSSAEVARRLGRRPRSVEQIHWLASQRMSGHLPPASSGDDSRLTPIERCVLRRLEAGENYGDIGNRVMRSGAQVRRIETWARFKLDGTWISPGPAA